MLDIVIRAGSFVAIILLGYFLKKIGFFKQEDFTILSRITIRITLPAAIITNFAGKQIDMSLLSLVLLAIGCGLLYILIGFFLNRKKSRADQAFAMLNLPGYNIGTFVIPFAQSFLGPMGVVACLTPETQSSAWEARSASPPWSRMAPASPSSGLGRPWQNRFPLSAM